jgi:hypothetical protein
MSECDGPMYALSESGYAGGRGLAEDLWWPVPGRVMPWPALARARRRAAEDGFTYRTPSLVVLRDGKQIPGQPPLSLDGRPAFTVGRDEVCDIVTAHPSCSGQHAVLCFKLPMPATIRGAAPDGAEDETRDPSWCRPTAATDGSEEGGDRVPELYVVDLGSTNGTAICDQRVKPWHYYPLLAGDTLTFGQSSRTYVVVES